MRDAQAMVNCAAAGKGKMIKLTATQEKGHDLDVHKHPSIKTNDDSRTSCDKGPTKRNFGWRVFESQQERDCSIAAFDQSERIKHFRKYAIGYRSFVRIPTWVSHALCEVCGERPAKFVLKNSWLLSCQSYAYKCKVDPLTLRCYGCGSTATKLSACGPTCGSDSRTGCVEVSNLTKRNSQATAKLNLLDPTLRAKRRRKFESTMMERYGATSANLVPELAAKARATCLERYGVEYGSQSKELMSTARVRYKKEHGVDHWTQLESTQLARKATCIERYGVEHSIQAQEVVESRRKNNLLKHGVIHPMQIPELAAAKYATWLRRNGAAFGSNKWRKSWVEDYQRIHGVAHPSQTAETHKRWTATNLECHGANYPVQCPSIMASHVSTLMSRYGVTNITHIPGAKEKARATTRELFGADYAIQSEEGQRRYKENSLNKHGVENPTQNPQVFRRILASLYSTHPLTLPSGRIVKYQGYENRSILRQLLTHTEDQIDFNAELAIP